MKRRTFVAGLAASVGVSRIAFAQTGQVPEVVLFYAGPVASAEARAKLIREALSADGLVEGKNYALSITVATDNGQLPDARKGTGAARRQRRACGRPGRVARRANGDRDDSDRGARPRNRSDQGRLCRKSRRIPAAM